MEESEDESEESGDEIEEAPGDRPAGHWPGLGHGDGNMRCSLRLEHPISFKLKARGRTA